MNTQTRSTKCQYRPGDLDDLVLALALVVAAPDLQRHDHEVDHAADTCRPWKPVIMKNAEPNCAAPIGLPHGRTPSSRISLVHSKACMPTKVAPKRRGDQHQRGGLAAIAAVAEVHRHRHRAAAGDQDERHDRDQDQRDVLAEHRQREHLARVRPRHRRRHAHVHVRVRKHEKMKVSLSRKIHIIALPQGTGRPACRREVGGDTGQTRGHPAGVRRWSRSPLPYASGPGSGEQQQANKTSQTSSR